MRATTRPDHPPNPMPSLPGDDRPPSLAEVRELAGNDAERVVAVWVPLESAVPGASGNALRLRHAGKALEERFGALGVDPGQASRTRARLDAFFAMDTPPPPGITARCAVLVGGREPFRCGLPFAIAEPRATVARCLPARPLLRAAALGRSYRVVAVSANRVRVASGDVRGLVDEPCPELPESLVDALGAEFEGVGVNFHSSTGHGGRAVYHGHHGAAEERVVDRERFHRVLADGLVRVFGATRIPIVWASDRQHQRLARELEARLPLAGAIDGSPDHWSERELHERAWPLVLEATRREQEEERGALEHARARHRVALGTLAAIEAVVDGRAHRLWLPAETSVPGQIDCAQRCAVDPWGDEDVFDHLASLALQRGGTVRVLEPDQPTLPDATVAVELR